MAAQKFPFNRDHPENDLHDEADFANRVPPEPASAESLASSQDPAVLAQRNRASTRQAIWYLVAVVAITLVLAGVLGLIARASGGPLCEAGEETWLCTDFWQLWWPILVSLPPVIGLLSAAVIMVRKLNGYVRWRPWMGVFWFLVVFTMSWLTMTLGMLATL